MARCIRWSLETSLLIIAHHGRSPCLWSMALASARSSHGFNYESVSEISNTHAFKTGIDQRDVFEGHVVCIVCCNQLAATHEHCHLIAQIEGDTVSHAMLSLFRYLTHLVGRPENS